MKDMLSSLSPENKKVIKIVIISVVSLIGFIVIFSIIRYVVGVKVSYNKLETIIENAATSYYQSNQDKLPSEGETNKVTSSELINGKYMRTMEKYTKDTCSAEVSITNNGGNYLYNTILDCNDYKTKTIGEVLTSTLVDSGDGLYLDKNEYYYRGEYVNNYIQIGNAIYRILSIDANGNIKVFDPNVGENEETVVWDDRYNSEVDDDVGINDYDKSRIKESANEMYNNFTPEFKKYIINSDWCIDKRDKDDESIDIKECTNVIKSYIGGILPQELVRPSLDGECNSLYSNNCSNYNYLNKALNKAYWTFTGNSKNSYEVYEIGSRVYTEDSNYQNYILRIFNISSNNIYISGDGKENSPYILK